MIKSGTIKWYNDEKRYGFIRPDEGGKDIFVHRSGIKSKGPLNLREGQKVTFEVVETPKGLKAINVKLVD